MASGGIAAEPERGDAARAEPPVEEARGVSVRDGGTALALPVLDPL